MLNGIFLKFGGYVINFKNCVDIKVVVDDGKTYLVAVFKVNKDTALRLRNIFEKRRHNRSIIEDKGKNAVLLSVNNEFIKVLFKNFVCYQDNTIEITNKNYIEIF